jgi:hypothetical protein
MSDPDTLETASMLCGTAAMKEHGQDFHSRHPVMTPDMVRQLPAGYALVIRGGYSPVIARLPMAWKDPLYRWARRSRRAIAELNVMPEAADWDVPDLVPDDILELRRPDTDERSFEATDGTRYPWDDETS